MSEAVSGRRPWTTAAASSYGWEAVSAAIAWRESHIAFPLNDPDRPHLRIGLCSSLSSGLLRDLVRHLADAPCPPELNFLEGSAPQILHGARRRDVDVAFVCGDHAWDHLEHETLWREPMFAALAEAHPLTSMMEVPPERLAQETLLVRGPVAEYASQQALTRQILGCAPSRMRCMDVDRETLVDLVGLGLGVTLVAGSSLGAFQPGVVYRPLAGNAGATLFSAAWKPGGANPALGPLLATARSLAARLRPAVQAKAGDPA